MCLINLQIGGIITKTRILASVRRLRAAMKLPHQRAGYAVHWAATILLIDDNRLVYRN